MLKKNKMFLIIKGNSQRIERKNFQELGGLPLHEFFIKQRKFFDIYIDTDSDEIFDFYQNNADYPYVNVYMREQQHIDIENDGNSSPAPQLIKRFLENHVNNDDEIVVTSHITSPFIKDSTIIEAIEKMKECDSVSSVLSVQEFCVDNIGNLGTAINFDSNKIVKTQSLTPIGILNGAFFIVRKGIFLNNNNRRISDHHFYFPIDEIEAMDIDTPMHLQLSRTLLKAEII